MIGDNFKILCKHYTSRIWCRFVLLTSSASSRKYRIAMYIRTIGDLLAGDYSVEEHLERLKAETTPEEFERAVESLFWSALRSRVAVRARDLLQYLPPGKKRDKLLVVLVNWVIAGRRLGFRCFDFARECIQMMTEPLRSYYFELFPLHARDNVQPQQQTTQQGI
jgi:hypothetical protein